MSGSDHVQPATPGVKLTYDDSRKADDVITTNLMRGLELPLARIFRE